MPEPVIDLKSLVSNVREYQRAVVRTGTRINPRLVRAWYYVPSLDMVAASRFIGYEGMTGELYDESGVSGSKTEAYLKSHGWFQELEPGSSSYHSARGLAESLCSPGDINPKARFSVLREEYDERVRTTDEGTHRQYWVISPNVDGTGKIVDEWKKEILLHPAVLLGWGPHETGHGGMWQSLKDKMQSGDIVLIARGKKQVDIVGFGVVVGDVVQKQFAPWRESVSMRDLRPFKQCKRAPASVPLLSVLQHSRALVQLHPDSNQNAKIVCEWMETELKLGSERKDKGRFPNQSPSQKPVGPLETDLPLSSTFGYKMITEAQVRTARQIEKRLLRDYQNWLANKDRNLSAVKYGTLKCDAWEKERFNLIEAKGSTSREDIRMAAGQLLDYAFQGKEMCQRSSKSYSPP